MEAEAHQEKTDLVRVRMEVILSVSVSLSCNIICCSL